MTKINIVAKNVRIDELPNVLAPVIRLKVAFEELCTDLGHFGLDHLVLLLLI